MFFLCIEGKARRQSCGEGLVFNPESLSCESQEKVDGPCQVWFNQTYLDSLTTVPPPALSPSITAGRVASEGRRRPRPPPQVNRQPLPAFTQQQQQPQEVIPQQLLDLENFGQQQPQPDFTSQRQTPSRSRVPVGLSRRPPQASFQEPQRGQIQVEQEEKEAFFNNLRTSIRQRDRVQQTTPPPARPFTRPPRRRPAAAPVQEEVANSFDSSQSSGFGRRRQPGIGRRRPTEAPAQTNLLEEVNATILFLETFINYWKYIIG